MIGIEILEASRFIRDSIMEAEAQRRKDASMVPTQRSRRSLRLCGSAPLG